MFLSILIVPSTYECVLCMKKGRGSGTPFPLLNEKVTLPLCSLLLGLVGKPLHSAGSPRKWVGWEQILQWCGIYSSGSISLSHWSLMNLSHHGESTRRQTRAVVRYRRWEESLLWVPPSSITPTMQPISQWPQQSLCAHTNNFSIAQHLPASNTHLPHHPGHVP